MAKTWFITGTSRGLGRVWAEAALARGDRVAASARDAATLEPLVATYGEAVLPLELDVSIRSDAEAAVRKAAEHFGRIDVLVNNAGYGLLGCVEEVGEEQARRLFETNFWGSMWLARAVLPVMREQGSGHVIQVSSQTGLVAFPTLGLYEASKFALEGLFQALAGEVAGHGIKVTLVEPAGYDTDWLGSSMDHAQRMSAYVPVHEFIAGLVAELELGYPEATAAAICAVVDAEEPPLKVFFGRGPLELISGEYTTRLAEWEAWSDVSRAAFGH
jgi:NAD(P)-dependent dehydrogenase (short-subunit alcohol dehydrogenase family)